ncbi:MAG: ABC transporter ATP-binding protein [Chloroflexi bacterium]|nr:ABC transporter ATP-binding protein [Chloroflexota bacterium]MCC6892179.1 ABC transporter ATP-binding protein [Anaerolineae bacterium]
MTPILDVQNLSIDYQSNGHPLHAVEDINFQVQKGRSLALVGESGCGKTTTMLSLLRLLPAEGRIIGGRILYRGTDLLRLSEREMRDYRWKKLAIVFQGAMNALNPVQRVSDQIAEAIMREPQITRKQALTRVGELIEIVGIPANRAQQYPHQFSGGMRQRAMIAMALACEPDVLIADEPTTALDVMIQAQILSLLQKLQRDLGLAVILVTHDLGVVAEVCDDVLVMYGGKVAEAGDVETIFNKPLHPYTQRLLQAFPDINRPGSTLASIAGHPPPLDDLPTGCRFEPRCHLSSEICKRIPPLALEHDAGHYVACHHVEQ